MDVITYIGVKFKEARRHFGMSFANYTYLHSLNTPKSSKPFLLSLVHTNKGKMHFNIRLNFFLRVEI